MLKKLSSGPEIYFQQWLTWASPGWKVHRCYPHKDQRNGKDIVITFLPHLQPQRQAGHWPYQAQPDDGDQLTGPPASLTTSDNCLSIGAQQTTPEHVLLCDWERSAQDNTVVKTFCREPYPAFQRISLHPFLSNSLLSGRVRNSVPSPKSEQLAYVRVAQQTPNLAPKWHSRYLFLLSPISHL